MWPSPHGRGRHATLPLQPARLAVDGTSASWSSGDAAPQSIALAFGAPVTLGEVDLGVDQWPPGIARHRVWASLRDGRRVLVADVERYLHPSITLAIVIDPPIPGVTDLRVETLESPAWVAWREIGAISADPGAEPCLVRATKLSREPRRGARPLPGAVGDALVLAEARLASDPAWLRVAGDRWIRAATPRCPGLPTVDGPALELVPVRFRVQVPAGSAEVFLAGDLGASTGLPAWEPATVFLGADGRTRTVTVPLPRGAAVEYKYVQGATWEGVEKGEPCAELPNRLLMVEPGLVVRDRVAVWADSC